jgi:hypothetical protein
VAAVQVARVGLGELARVGAVVGLFVDDVGAAVRTGHQQPGVVREPLVRGGVLADPAGGLELVHGAVDGGTEGDPVEGDAGTQHAAGVIDRHAGRVGVPVRPSSRTDQAVPDDLGGSFDDDVVVGEQVGAVRVGISGPVDVGLTGAAYRR